MKVKKLGVQGAEGADLKHETRAPQTGGAASGRLAYGHFAADNGHKNPLIISSH